MSQQISDLGNSRGYIYITAPNGTSIISALVNTPENARNIKVDGLKGTATALNKKAYSTITFTAITGAGSITAITTASGISQIGTSVAYTGATTTSELAALVAAEMNSHQDLAAEENCTAYAYGAVVYVYLEAAAGSTLNGTPLVVTDTGNMTNVVTDFEGGSDATKLYDESIGYRFFLNADYDATGCSGVSSATDSSLTNSWEITDYIIPLSMNMAIPVKSATISGGGITVARTSVDTLIYVDTESYAASDDLDTIVANGYANGDKITIRGNSSGRVTTVKDGTGNIELQSSNDFSTGATQVAITLQLKDSTWYEVSRTSQSVGTTSDYRTAGFGFFGIDLFNTATVATSGTTTFTAGTSDKYQKLTGSGTLSGNTSYALSGGVNGDRFILEYDASVTAGAFALSIFGITLTTAQALNGGLIFVAEYMEGAWYPRVYPNLNDGSTYTWQAGTADIKDGAVTPDKAGGGLEIDLIPSQISWDTNRLGDHKIVIPFNCTVNQIDVYADDLIEATDDADVNFKNNAGLSMGTITFTGGDTIGTGYSITPSSNNTLTTGQIITMTTTKSTAGGNAKVSLKVTKTL